MFFHGIFLFFSKYHNNPFITYVHTHTLTHTHTHTHTVYVEYNADVFAGGDGWVGGHTGVVASRVHILWSEWEQSPRGHPLSAREALLTYTHTPVWAGSLSCSGGGASVCALWDQS